MNNQISFTPAELVAGILWICGTITAVAAAVTVIIKAVQKAKQPEKTQNERIEKLEHWRADVERMLDNDNKRLIAIEEGNRITQEALLALLGHAKNGNNTDQIIKAEQDLKQYLINR
jgi:hypothetical protein